MSVLKESLSAPAFSRKEALRYMGAAAESSTLSALLDDCLRECAGALRYDVCYRILPIGRQKDKLYAGDLVLPGRDLARYFAGCTHTLLFAATVGPGMDRLIHRYGPISPARALCYEAIGSERIEALCNAFCDSIKQKMAANGSKIRPRFSPGYGDCPLSLQEQIFLLLDPPRQIGLTLGKGGIMIPKKSVTAFVGIKEKES